MRAQEALHYADLEIRILPRRDHGYPVEITFSGEREFPGGHLDPGILPWVPGVSPREDGERLFALLFGDPRLRDAWVEARGQSSARRIRLRIDAEAPELHAIPWELLCEASPGEPARPLAAAPDTPFSRYLAGAWRPGRAVLERPLRLLVAIANPDDLAERGLEPLDADAERQTLEEALSEVDPSELEVTFLDSPVTLPALEAALRRGPHLLHLIAHGRFSATSGKVALYLADADNRLALTRDEEFAAMLARQGEDLRLVFLASCQSATRSPADAFRGLAPQLIAAGVPAVVAMQERVPLETARAFAGTFYRQLLRHGLVDLAANEARSALLTGKLPGAAIPVLYVRLKNALLFSRRGQILGSRAAGFWVTLLDNVAEGDCTPLLGPGVTKGLMPAPEELARSLARKYGYPFPDGDHLPRVAQFVGTLDQTTLRRDVLRLLAGGFRAWHGLRPEPPYDERRLAAARKPAPGQRLAPREMDEKSRERHRSLAETIRAAEWPERVREERETEIHHQLADLGLPLYLTTNCDNFMTLALEAKGRRPRRQALAWRAAPELGAAGPNFDREPPASPEEPVVLHLFGNDDDPRSLVLTEDDYLDYLSRISRDHEYLLPASVSAALARTTLLFLGYDLRDLDLKIILRGLLSHLDAAGWDRLHVAVQIDTRDAGEGSTNEVKRFLERYFGKAEVDVYWGSTHQFITELHQRWQEYAGG